MANEARCLGDAYQRVDAVFVDGLQRFVKRFLIGLKWVVPYRRVPILVDNLEQPTAFPVLVNLDLHRLSVTGDRLREWRMLWRLIVIHLFRATVIVVCEGLTWCCRGARLRFRCNTRSGSTCTKAADFKKLLFDQFSEDDVEICRRKLQHYRAPDFVPLRSVIGVVTGIVDLEVPSGRTNMLLRSRAIRMLSLPIVKFT